MMATTKLRPAKKFGPGYFIREQMEYRNWIQEDLAEVMGVTPKHINKILQDKQDITLDMAKVLAEVFETSPQYWLNLDANYRLWLQTEKSEKEVQADLKAKIYERMPIRDMIHKNWLPDFGSLKELYTSVLSFWGVNELDFEAWDKRTLPILARKSESFNQYNAAYTFTWYHKAMQTAQKYQVGIYNREMLKQLFDNIHSYTMQENGYNIFINELNKAGVIFFILPHLQKTYLDGSAFFVGGHPVIVYTGRYKRIDNFWFTVAHEIGHILYHFDKPDAFFVDNFSEKDIDNFEKEANSYASYKLKHNEIYEYLKPKLNYLTKQAIVDCSKRLQIHPAIIIGKLAHEKTISYANQNLFNDDVLKKIDSAYIN
ncbi:MAG: HigA family addiction module antitoxin [Bacteroidales bacterium]|nr:HigA family addiction module antitoxin [Bacteroidales bacterium]